MISLNDKARQDNYCQIKNLVILWNKADGTPDMRYLDLPPDILFENDELNITMKLVMKNGKLCPA